MARYVADLRVLGAAVEFVLPTAVAPRYAPARERDTVGTGALTQAQLGLRVTLHLDMASAIVGVRSATHAVRTTPGHTPEQSTVELAAEVTFLDKDLVMLIETATPHAPRLLVQTSPQGRTAAMLSIVPQLALEQVRCEFVFVVDLSGSMDDKIADTRNAMQVRVCVCVCVCVCLCVCACACVCVCVCVCV
jgi:hypothetical protein